MITQRLVSESNQLCSSVDDPEVSISALSVASVADTRATQFLPNGELGPYQLLERVGAGGGGSLVSRAELSGTPPRSHQAD